MKDRFEAYTLKIVGLGQAALAARRRGLALPENLASLADELLGLEEASDASAPLVAPSGDQDVLVLDVDEEPGGGPVSIGRPLDALPPLVIEAIDEPLVSVDGNRYCANCGALLRPGKRFCYRCGAPIAAVSDSLSAPG